MSIPHFLRLPLALLLLTLVTTTLVYQFPHTASIDIGSGRDTPFIQGFSFRENASPEQSFRWSKGAAEIRFWGVGAQDGTVTLRMNIPEQNRAAGIKVWANEKLLGTVQAASAGEEFTFPITRSELGWNGDLFVKIVTSTFSAPPDTRSLGVQLDTIQFVGQGAPVTPAPRAIFYFSALTLLLSLIARMWSDNRAVGLAAGIMTLLGSALGLMFARVETAYFSAPLFWFAVFLLVGARVLVFGMRRLTFAMNAPALSARAVRLVFVMMAAAFVLRLVLAIGPGYIVDTQDYVVWSYKTVTYGLGTMYSAPNGLWISDQSPGLNYILHGMGLLYREIFSPDFLYPAVAGDPTLRALSQNPAVLADPIQRTLLRVPMLFADLLTGALIFVVARKYFSERGAWLAALAFWFNPAVFWNGAYWGQTDAIHTLLVLICFLLIVFTRRVGFAFFIFGIAAFTKPQAMIFGPLLLLGAYRKEHVKGALDALACGALGAVILLLPVVLTGGLQGLLALFGDAVGHHPTLSANAHNLWWLIFHDHVDTADTLALFPGAPISYRTFSILLFGIFYCATLFKAWREPLAEFFGLGAFIAFAFLMLPTEIHENYGYALLPLLAVAMTRDRTLLALYAGMTLSMTFNYALHDPPLYERFGLFDPHAQWALPRRLNALFNVVMLGAWTLYLFARQGMSLFRWNMRRAQEISQ